MTAQPLHLTDDPHDPRIILRALPDEARHPFLAAYQAAVDEARDPAGYQRLQEVLRTWATLAIAYRKPDYQEGADDVWAGAGGYTSLDDLAARYDRAR